MKHDMNDQKDGKVVQTFLQTIGDKYLEYELEILKNGDDTATWHQYMEAVSSVSEKLAVLHRALKHMKASRKYHESKAFWVKYLNLMLDQCRQLNYYEHKQQFDVINDLFVECLTYFNDIKIWHQYLGFLNRQSNVKYILNEYVRCLRSIDFEQHELIWPSFLVFNDNVAKYSPSLAFKVLLRFISFGKFDIHHLVKLAELSSQMESKQDLPRNILISGNYTVDDWKLVMEYIHDEETVAAFLGKFPDEYSYGQLVLISNYDNDLKIHHYIKALNGARTVYDFTTIYDAYITYLEHQLTADTDVFDLDHFEKLLNDRKVMINSIYLNSDSQNLNHWFKKFEIYEDTKDLANLLKTLVAAITSINPFTCYGDHKLSDIWVKYASVYSKNKDLKTANLIYAKSVKTKFKNKNELIDLYLSWSKMFIDNDDIDGGIKVLEDIIFKNEDISRSMKLWMYYFEVLEVNSELTKILPAYYKMIELKYATANAIFSMTDFLEDEEQISEMFKLFECSIGVFEDANIRAEIYNRYLPKLIAHTKNLETVRDVFDKSLRQVPDSLQKPIVILYSQFEYDNGLMVKSFNLLNTFILHTKTDPLDVILLVIEKFNGHVDLRKTLEQYMSLKLAPQTLITLLREFIKFEISNKQFTRVRYLFEYLHANANYPYKDWEEFELEYGDESTFKEFLRFKSSHPSSDPQGFVKGTKVEATSTENPDEIDIDM